MKEIDSSILITLHLCILILYIVGLSSRFSGNSEAFVFEFEESIETNTTTVLHAE